MDRRVTRVPGKKKAKSADKKSNTQANRRKKYKPILDKMQEGSQNRKILELLIRKGNTTSMDIIMSCNITNPTARMSELRNHYGLPITKTTIVTKNDEGHRVSYGKYTLEV